MSQIKNESTYVIGSDGFYLHPSGKLLMVASTVGNTVGILPNYFEGITEYPYWNISFQGTWRYYPCHILMAETFLTKPTEYTGKLVVNHKDGNKCNFSLSNLEWITQSENVLHALRNDFRTNATPYIVVEGICMDIDSGLSNQEIAAKYQVHHSTVCSIRNGRRWAQVAHNYKFGEKFKTS